MWILGSTQKFMLSDNETGLYLNVNIWKDSIGIQFNLICTELKPKVSGVKNFFSDVMMMGNYTIIGGRMLNIWHHKQSNPDCKRWQKDKIEGD